MTLDERCTLLEQISSAQVSEESPDTLLHTFSDKIANNILLSAESTKSPLHILSVFDSLLKTQELASESGNWPVLESLMGRS